MINIHREKMGVGKLSLQGMLPFQTGVGEQHKQGANSSSRKKKTFNEKSD